MLGAHPERPPGQEGACGHHAHGPAPVGPSLAGGSCSGGPRRTSAAVEGTLEDSEGHHLAQRPPDGHRTVGPPWASQVDGSCGRQVLPAAGTWRRSRGQVRGAPGGGAFPAGQGLSRRLGEGSRCPPRPGGTGTVSAQGRGLPGSSSIVRHGAVSGCSGEGGAVHRGASDLGPTLKPSASLPLMARKVSSPLASEGDASPEPSPPFPGPAAQVPGS